MKKLFVGLAVTFLFVSLAVLPLASAVDDVIVFNASPHASYYNIIYTLHPSAGAGKSGVAHLFDVDSGDNGTYLTKIYFMLAKVGSPDFNITAKLYGASSTVGADCTLNSTLHDTSITTYNTGDVSSSLYAYPFIFNSTYQLVGGAYYYAVLTITGGSGDVSNYLKVYLTGGTSFGYEVTDYYNYGSWHSSVNNGALTVYANVDPVYDSPTPTPYPSGTTSSGDSTIEDLTNIILPWLVPLLVCLIPALLAYKYVGEMGFFIGLNIGAILAYVTLASTAYAFPLWGIILVGVMDVAVVLMRR